eukprot:gene7831-2772_t
MGVFVFQSCDLASEKKWGPRAETFVKEVAVPTEHATRIREKLAAVIQHANADMILHQLGYHNFW